MIRVKSTEDLSLIGTPLTLTLTAFTAAKLEVNLKIQVNYKQETHTLSFSEASLPKPLTCSEKDAGWSYKIPEVVGAE